MVKHYFRGKTTEQKNEMIEWVCKCMLTSPSEWEKYAARRDTSQEVGDACEELREGGLLM
jgi:hypothetical protein